MKRIISLLFVSLLMISLVGCAGGYDPSKHEREKVKVSKDDTLAYVEDFVGLTLDQVGYTSLSGKRMTRVGEGILEFVIMTNDGTSIDIQDEASLKNYIVAGQELKPNTEIKMGFDEHEFVDWQSYEKMTIEVIKVGEKLPEEPTFTTISPVEDNEHAYIRNYVGCNLYNIGFTNLFDERVDKYGQTVLKLIINTEDNTKITLGEEEDEEALKDYVVVSQNIEPNSLMNIGYGVDEDGEKEDIPNFRSYEEIVLNIAKIGSTNDASNVANQPSEDFATHYIRNYVGRNLANCGFTTILGERRDDYGRETLRLSLIGDNGEYIELDEDNITVKDYVVVDQNLKPNTKLKYSYNDGRYHADGSNYDEILLRVKKIGSSNSDSTPLLEIKESPDKYTKYMKDYVGRNLAECIKFGFSKLYVELHNEYIETILCDEDDYAVEVTEDNVSNYMVVAQDVAPNSEIKFTYRSDMDGNEYSFPSETSVDKIYLTVKEIK